MTRKELLEAMVENECEIKSIQKYVHPCDIYKMPAFCANFSLCSECMETFWNDEVKI